MTFFNGVFAVDGNTEDAVILRQMLWASTLGSQGVVGHLDCIVTATSPATNGVNISAGQVVVLGAETANQGSYFGINPGVDNTLSGANGFAAAGPSGRSDMVVVRAEDPTWSGSPWTGPASGQIIFPRIIQNVGNTAQFPPGGQSDFALCRVDFPANATTVQSGYITDLRQVCNPQRSVQMFTAQGANPSTATQTGVSPIQWPPQAQWTVPIPNYATKVAVFFQVNEAGYSGSGVGNGVARGSLFGAFATSILLTPSSLYSMNATSGPGRHCIAGGGLIGIPAVLRGTSTTFQIYQVADGTNTGTMFSDEGTSMTVIFEFYQGAALA